MPARLSRRAAGFAVIGLLLQSPLFVEDANGQTEGEACAPALALIEAGRLDAAERELAGIEDECTAEALEKVGDQRDDAATICGVADRLRDSGQADAARDEYLAALSLDRESACALDGLEAANSVGSNIVKLALGALPILIL